MAKEYLDYDGLLYFWQKIKAKFAPLASPAFTGTPTAPTATTGTSNGQIATTEFVANTVGAISSGVTDVQVDGTSVVSNSVATINTFAPAADADTNGTKGLVPAPNRTNYSSRYSTVLTAARSWSVVSFMRGTDQSDSTKQAIHLMIGTERQVATPLEASSSTNGFMSVADKVKLDSITMTNGIIDASVLPSYVDDVIEAYPVSGATELSAGWLSKTSGGSALTPETGKIYVLMSDTTSYSANSQFRWGGTAYVKLADGGVSSITNGEIDTILAS